MVGWLVNNKLWIIVKQASCPNLRCYPNNFVEATNGASWLFQPWGRRRNIPPEIPSTFNWLHGAISQKTELWQPQILLVSGEIPKTWNPLTMYSYDEVAIRYSRIMKSYVAFLSAFLLFNVQHNFAYTMCCLKFGFFFPALLHGFIHSIWKSN
jgi:hypothetical protein